MYSEKNLDNKEVYDETDNASQNIDTIDNELRETLDEQVVIEPDENSVPNDTLIEKDYLSSLIEQKDRIVYYEVENIYRNEQSRTYKNRFNMRKDPPVLVVRDNYGNEAEFYLTENLTDELIYTLGEVKRGYLGFSSPKDLDKPTKLMDKIKYYFKKSPLKITFPILLIIIIVVLSTMK